MHIDYRDTQDRKLPHTGGIIYHVDFVRIEIFFTNSLFFLPTKDNDLPVYNNSQSGPGVLRVETDHLAGNEWIRTSTHRRIESSHWTTSGKFRTISII